VEVIKRLQAVGKRLQAVGKRLKEQYPEAIAYSL
jgi:hypothetical protein